MIHHNTCRNMFVEAIYGDLDDAHRQSFDEHIQSCTSCAKEFRDLSGLVEVLRERVRPERTPQEWTSFWNELSASVRVLPSPSSTRRWLPNLAWWTPTTMRLVGAAAALLAVGIIIGRLTWSPGNEDAMNGTGDTVPEAERVVLRQETLEYLDRSKILLLGIVNGEEELGEDYRLTRPRERSRKLVMEGAALRARLNEADYGRLGALVEDLEVLLLEIANLQAENNFPGLEIIRDGVKRKGILLKINLEQMRSEGIGRNVAPEPTHDKQRSSI